MKTKVAFQSGDRIERKTVQKRLREEIREAKKQFKEKVELQFQSGNMRDAWKGFKTLTGQQHKTHGTAGSLSKEDWQDFYTKLNDFFCRFERHDLGGELAEVMSELWGMLGEGRALWSMAILFSLFL